MQVTAPAIMTAQHGANDPASCSATKLERGLCRRNAAMARRVSDSFSPTPSVRRHKASTAS
jgi:hypothetical protein